MVIDQAQKYIEKNNNKNTEKAALTSVSAASTNNLLGAYNQSQSVSAENVSVAPIPAYTPANGSAVKETPTSEKYFLMYDGIKIIGDKPFIKDVVLSLEFGKIYYPEGELKYTKEIESRNAVREMSAAKGHTSVNASSFHNWLEKKLYGTVLAELKHEDFHNGASLNDPKNNTEKNAGLNSISTWNNLTSVPKSNIIKFEETFDFKKYEKEIKPI